MTNRSKASAPVTLVTEADFQQTVIDFAKLRAWSVYHTHDSRSSAAGFPDLVLARPPQLLFVELKTEAGMVSQAQKEWVQVLNSCDKVMATVWRPRQWDVIQRILE